MRQAHQINRRPFLTMVRIYEKTTALLAVLCRWRPYRSCSAVRIAKRNLPSTSLTVSHRPPCFTARLFGHTSLSPSPPPPLPHQPSSTVVIIDHAPLLTLSAVLRHPPCLPCFAVNRVGCAPPSVLFAVLSTCHCRMTARSTSCCCSSRRPLLDDCVRSCMPREAPACECHR